MSRSVFAAIMALALVAPVAAVAGRSSYDTGYRRAMRHGFSGSQAACYGSLYSQHASLNSHGHFALPGGKGRRSPFRALAWQNCGISL